MTLQFKNILQELADKLVIQFEPEIIYLFGSHAWGVPTADSDIDIMVLLNQSDQPKARRAASAYKVLRNYSDLSIDILVRTIDEFEPYSKVKATLQNKIVNEGIVLYERRIN